MPTRTRRILAAIPVVVALGCSRRLPEAVGGAGPPQGRREWIDAILAPLAIGDRIRVRPQPTPVVSWPGAKAGERGLPGLALAVAAVALRPDDPDALERLGSALLEVSRPTEAEAAFRSALDVAPDRPGPQRGLAVALGRLGRRHEAVAAWRGAIAAGDEGGAAKAALAAALFLDGDREGARFELAAAHELGAEVPSVLELLLDGTAARPPAQAPFELGAEVRVDAGGSAQAAETTVAATGGALVAAWNDLREAASAGEWRLAVAASTDGGETWVDGLLRPAGPAPSPVHEGDPMAAFDPASGGLWAGGQRFGTTSVVYVARWNADGTGFDPPVTVAAGPLFDRPWMTAGGSPATRLYVTYSSGELTGHLHKSTDLGATWSAPTAMPAASSFLPRLGPGGALWIAYYDFVATPARYVVLRSSNGGASFDVQRTAVTRLDDWDFQDGSRFPGAFRVPPLHGFAVDPVGGDLYLAWFDTAGASGGDADVDVFVTRSTDAGVTWSPPVVPHAKLPAGDQFFPWLEVSADRRVHLAFFDSRRTVQSDADSDGRLDVVYATSSDHGATWAETFVTDLPFSSLDAPWPGFDQFLGDHLGLAVDSGDAVVVYPSTRDGDLDVFARRLRREAIFASGFESGDTGDWSAAF